MPQLHGVPGTNLFFEVMLTARDAPRVEEGWSHEFEPPHRWGYGKVYRLAGRVAVLVGRLEPEPVPRDLLGREEEHLRLIEENEIDSVRANLDADHLRLIQQGARAWYSDRLDTLMYEVEKRLVKPKMQVAEARRRLRYLRHGEPPVLPPEDGFRPIVIDPAWSRRQSS